MVAQARKGARTVRAHWREIGLGLVVAGIVVVYLLLIPAIHTIGLQQRLIADQQAQQTKAAQVTKRQSRAACLRTRALGPGVADFFEYYGVEKTNPKTGRPFFSRRAIRDYRATIPVAC